MCLTHCVSAGSFDGGNHVVSIQMHVVVRGRDRDGPFCTSLYRLPGELIELLALPLIHVRPDGVAVGAVELGVDIDQGLHVVVACGDLAQALQRIAERVAVDNRHAAR